MNELATLLFLMAAAHALCDFPLQPAGMACAKRPGGDDYCPWQFALGAHSLIHGGAVAMITGTWWLGVAETLAHAIIDGLKCRGWYGMKIDQGLHGLCKIAWAGIAVIVAPGS